MVQTIDWSNISDVQKQHYHSLGLEDREDVFLDYIKYQLNKTRTGKGFYIKHCSTGAILTKIYNSQGPATRALTKMIQDYEWSLASRNPNGSTYSDYWRKLTPEIKPSEWSKKLLEMGIVEVVEIK